MLNSFRLFVRAVASGYSVLRKGNEGTLHMLERRLCFLLVVLFLLLAGLAGVHAQSPNARALLEESANAMGGLKALRAVKNQVVVSAGHQFEPEQSLVPDGPARHVAEFRYKLLREPANRRLRLEWNGQRFYPRENPVRYIEVIDGSKGFIEETRGTRRTRQSRLHPGRLASRLREERRTAIQIVLTALEHDDLKRLPDLELGGRLYHILNFQEDSNEFLILIDATTKLPAQVIIIEDDSVYGDSRYALKFDDWREVDGLKIPFVLRYEINDRLLQIERRLSVRHNVNLPSDTFSIPEAIAQLKAKGEPIASQWLLRRLAMNVSYLYFAANPPINLVPLADGVVHARGASHQPVIVEMRDYLVVVEAPLYEERSEAILKAIKARFPGKPVRYIILTHFHNDHSGGIRTYIAEGATIVAPAVSVQHYRRVAKAPHTLQPDRLQKNWREPKIEVNPGRKIITDGTRRVEIYYYPTSHAFDFQIVYLPQEGLLIEADHVSPRGSRIRPGPLPRQIVEAINELNLNVKQIVGIHGAVGSIEDLLAAVESDSR